MKKRHLTSKERKAIKKQEQQMIEKVKQQLAPEEQLDLAVEDQLEEPAVPEESVTSKFTIKKLIPLSDLDYRVFRIIHAEEKIGYFGVRSNGKFKYSLTASEFEPKEVLCFIEDYIREALGLVPINISK